MGTLVPFRGVLKVALFLSGKEAPTTWHKFSVSTWSAGNLRKNRQL